MLGFVHKIFKNLASVFRSRNLLWHLVAIVLTYMLVFSGFDWFYFQATRNTIFQLFLFPAVLFGAFIPIFGILIFFLISTVRKNAKFVNTAYALGQAAILGLVVSDFYKAFTGRMGPPEIFGNGPIVDISRDFRFGFLRGGVFWGWPSTHTTIAFAMAFTIFMLYRNSRFARSASLLYAFYIGIGVSATIHWFSDFVAGAIIGSVIGIVVGKSFLSRYSSLKGKN